MSHIYLIGFMATGKTTLGQAVARKLSRHFMDTDAEIEHIAGKSVTEIFNSLGEKRFREMELEVLQSISALDNCIIATGGGTPLLPGAMDLMKVTGTVVRLVASPERILERVMLQKNQRPKFANLTSHEVMSQILKLMKLREPYYAQAPIEFNTERLETPREVEETAQNFINLLRLH